MREEMRRSNSYGNEDSRARPKLEWKLEETFEDGRVVGLVQSAETERGKRYSFRVGKISRDNPDRPFPHMDPRDIPNVQRILQDIQTWVDCDRAENYSGVDHYQSRA